MFELKCGISLSYPIHTAYMASCLFVRVNVGFDKLVVSNLKHFDHIESLGADKSLCLTHTCACPKTLL